MKDVTPTVIRYYTEAGPDYSNWSANFNMHFGYYQRGMSLFNLEAMLEQMNHAVLAELGLSQEAPETILDMGCGVGATLQYACKLLNNVSAYGLTIVPWQIERARELNNQQGFASKPASDSKPKRSDSKGGSNQ